MFTGNASLQMVVSYSGVDRPYAVDAFSFWSCRPETGSNVEW